MPERLESEIEAKVVEYAIKRGVLQIKIEKRRGWPDRWFGYNGKTLWIEFKRPGEKPEPLQEHMHGKLRTNGFDVAVVDNVKSGCITIDRFVRDSSDF